MVDFASPVSVQNLIEHRVLFGDISGLIDSAGCSGIVVSSRL